jgi:ADP-ribosylglycohydrolase
MSRFRKFTAQLSDLADWADLRSDQGLAVSGDFAEVLRLIGKKTRKLAAMQPPKALLAREPNGLAAIRALRPRGAHRYWQTIPPLKYGDRLAGAWLGRCAGCTLGAAVEFFPIADMQALARETGGSWPPTDYWPQAWAPYRERYGKDMTRQYAKSHLAYVPVDDDLTYTLLDLLILEDYGPGFTTAQAGRAWLKYLPMACTAERAALDNLRKGVPAARSALVRNPWMEWIGGDIRVDGWGYLAPGWPEQAAELAWRELWLSHRFSGIYGGMYVAAAISAAFALGDTEAALVAGLAEIPRECRTAKAVRWALGQQRRVRNWQAARAAVDRHFQGLSQVHTDNNLCLSIFGLLIGRRDFTRVIGQTVAMGMDNDCTAATAGSITGAIVGKQGIAPHWYRRFNNTVRSYFYGNPVFKISDLIRRFASQAKKVWQA